MSNLAAIGEGITQAVSNYQRGSAAIDEENLRATQQSLLSQTMQQQKAKFDVEMPHLQAQAALNQAVDPAMVAEAQRAYTKVNWKDALSKSPDAAALMPYAERVFAGRDEVYQKDIDAQLQNVAQNPEVLIPGYQQAYNQAKNQTTLLDGDIKALQEKIQKAGQPTDTKAQEALKKDNAELQKLQQQREQQSKEATRLQQRMDTITGAAKLQDIQEELQKTPEGQAYWKEIEPMIRTEMMAGVPIQKTLETVTKGMMDIQKAKVTANAGKFSTPLPTTDKGWTISAEKGVVVARKQNPDGTITSEPYDVSKHGQAYKTGENPTIGGMPTYGLKPGADTSLTGEAALSNYTEDVQKLASMYANYQAPIPTGFAMRDPKIRAAITLAPLINPAFDEKEYPKRFQVMKSFSSGLDAKNINSINTLVGHLDSLRKSAAALENTTVPLFNKAVNWMKTQSGNPTVKRFNMDLGAVESELANVFKGTGATDQEIKAWRERINAADSPQQLKSEIDEAITLMGSRLEAIRNKFIQGMGDARGLQILSPKSRSILSKIVGEERVEALDPKQEIPTIQKATTTTETPSWKHGQKIPQGYKEQYNKKTGEYRIVPI